MRGANEDVDSYAYGVKDAGVIVGCSGEDAVRWVNKRMQNLNALIDRHSGWDLSCARGINRAGTIVGTGELGNSDSLPFRLVPLTAGHAGHTARSQPPGAWV